VAVELSELKELLGRLCRLYGAVVSEDPGGEVLVPLLSAEPPGGYAPAPARPGPLPGAAGADLEYFLRLLFEKPGFRPGQRSAVVRLLEGSDAFVLLPTGAGKSVVYQLAGMLRPGVCLVVAPTLALIDDQRVNLARAGIGRTAALTSGMVDAPSRARAMAMLIRGDCRFFFASPERLQTPEFRRALKLAAKGPGIGLVAVDEAHCVSEWGHDFRTAYLRIGGTLRSLAPKPPVAALTGTASLETRADISRHLGLEGCPIGAFGIGRKELEFKVVRCPSGEKTTRLAELLKNRVPGSSALVFCPHVEGEFGAQSAARALRERGFEPGVYHGKPPRGMEEGRWRERKEEAAGAFRDDPAGLLVATKAFGLGIDKADIRTTVHLGLPGSLEALWQEAGRAGRDGRPAECWVLASVSSLRRARRLLDPRTPCASARAEAAAARAGEADDVTRALAMHFSGFRGPGVELSDALEVFDRLGGMGRPRAVRLSMPTQHQPLIEKALYRLLSAGVVLDYAVRYGASEFTVVLSGEGRSRVEVEAALERLLEGIYRKVEPVRRAALLALVEACLEGEGGRIAERVGERLGAQTASSGRDSKNSEPGTVEVGGCLGLKTFQPRSWSIWKYAVKKARMAASAMKFTFS
jgi:ATP-dependent DNA helicase RecQ